MQMKYVAEHFGKSVTTISRWSNPKLNTKTKLNRKPNSTPACILIDDDFYAACEKHNRPYKSELDQESLDNSLHEMPTKRKFKAKVKAKMVKADTQQPEQSETSINLDELLAETTKENADLKRRLAEYEQAKTPVDFSRDDWSKWEDANSVEPSKQDLLDKIVSLEQLIKENQLVDTAKVAKELRAQEQKNILLAKRLKSAEELLIEKEEKIDSLNHIIDGHIKRENSPIKIDRIAESATIALGPENDIVYPTEVDEFTQACIRASVDPNSDFAIECRRRNLMPDSMTIKEQTDILKLFMPKNNGGFRTYSSNMEVIV